MRKPLLWSTRCKIGNLISMNTGSEINCGYSTRSKGYSRLNVKLEHTEADSRNNQK
jgi:hypothetical protein